jgi:hypothetical protein
MQMRCMCGVGGLKAAAGGGRDAHYGDGAPKSSHNDGDVWASPHPVQPGGPRALHADRLFTSHLFISCCSPPEATEASDTDAEVLGLISRVQGDGGDAVWGCDARAGWGASRLRWGGGGGGQQHKRQGVVRTS